jgi:hypothetical protein
MGDVLGRKECLQREEHAVHCRQSVRAKSTTCGSCRYLIGVSHSNTSQRGKACSHLQPIRSDMSDLPTSSTLIHAGRRTIQAHSGQGCSHKHATSASDAIEKRRDSRAIKLECIRILSSSLVASPVIRTTTQGTLTRGEVSPKSD